MSAPKPTLDQSAPSQWLQQEAAHGKRVLGVADLQSWWRRFEDPQLNALVDQALAQNLNLAQALGRLKQQRLLLGVANAEYRPEVKAGIRTLQDVAALDSYFHASIDVVWDLGLFGARESNLLVAQAQLLDAEAQVRAAKVSLVAAVVHRWLDIRMAQMQRQLLADQLRLDERAVRWAETRLAQRLDGSEPVHQAQLQWGQSRAQLASLKESQARAAHALAALLGRAQPDAVWLAEDPLAQLPQPQTLALNILPADLLRTRPDIESAEANVARAAGALGLSRSALYPRFALSGSLLFSYNLTQNRRSTSADRMPLIGPVIDIPLFDWSRRRSQADADETALDIALQAYRQSVLEGIAEVESALAGLSAQRERREALSDTRERIAAREDLLKRRERLGLASEFSRVGESRALLQNQSERIVAQGAQALAYVALYKALGGAPLPEQTSTQASAQSVPAESAR